jgi:hypothetical protein
MRWRTVKGYPDYKICEDGRIVSLIPPSRQLKHNFTSGGYPQVTMYGIGKKRVRTVHTLLLETFIGPRPSPIHQGCHKDGNNKHCYLSNLKWGLPVDNYADRKTAKGEAHGMARLTKASVLYIRQQLEKGVLEQVLAEQFGVTQPHISDIKHKRRWKTV